MNRVLAKVRVKRTVTLKLTEYEARVIAICCNAASEGIGTHGLASWQITQFGDLGISATDGTNCAAAIFSRITAALEDGGSK